MTTHSKLGLFNLTAWFALMSIIALSLGCGQKSETIPQKVVQAVNPDYFIADSLVEPIQKEMRTLSDGSKAECYVITTKAVPTDHQLGPWAPKHVTDGEDKDGKEPMELDECSGHYDDVRGYHYHASAAGDNQIIGAFRGIAGSASIVNPE